MQEFVINSLEDLPVTAKKICDAFNIKKQMPENNCLAFYGEMGAGKTTLIKEICNVLGISDSTSSPTFSLINEYLSEDGTPVYHFDFYRINKIEEAYDLGYEDYFYSEHLCMIEWPEKIENLLPEKHIKIQIEILGNQERKILIDKVE